MIYAVLMMLLVLFSVACVLFFIFYLLLPSLNAQKVNTSNPLFSEQEFQRFPPAGRSGFSQRAVVLCSSPCSTALNPRSYRGFRDCTFYDSQFEARGECRYGCIGLGSCRRACPRNAISIVKGRAVVNVLCDGCGECVSRCPRGLIKLVPSSYSKEAPCEAYTRTGGAYKEGCGQFGGSVDFLSPGKVPEPKSYAFWRSFYGLFHRA